ncbi:MAG: hypothetical protein ACU0CY_12965 [Maritimibacter harenae]|jgi:ElaB/YqjD/DUF883 family membrane-anchored ribosome-binding protein|uniref:DUF883 domain-containing protein n=1 Tax=Maritimibacter harenae TaxID=2606218 RepID=A0A845LWX6_9RHOB|nr:hypothetical protein [Maritimibacter harenae]MZR11866.1 hypothetical protein [Maritimibacter harenae]
MAKQSTETKAASQALHADAEAELEELREAALLLGRNLKDFGKARLRAAGADLGETSETMLARGREMEKAVEHSMRAHPANWVAGTLGVVGVGVLIGMLLRNRQ